MYSRRGNRDGGINGPQDEPGNQRLDQILVLLTQQGQHMDDMENALRGWQTKEDEHREVLHQEEEARKKGEEDQLVEAQRKQEEDRRIEEQQKEEVDRRMAGLVHDRVQIAEDLSRDLKKVTPPTFNGKTTGEEAEAWIATMEKYFHVHNFTGKSRAVWTTFQLVGEAAT